MGWLVERETVPCPISDKLAQEGAVLEVGWLEGWVLGCPSWLPASLDSTAIDREGAGRGGGGSFSWAPASLEWPPLTPGEGEPVRQRVRCCCWSTLLPSPPYMCGGKQGAGGWQDISPLYKSGCIHTMMVSSRQAWGLAANSARDNSQLTQGLTANWTQVIAANWHWTDKCCQYLYTWGSKYRKYIYRLRKQQMTIIG